MLINKLYEALKTSENTVSKYVGHRKDFDQELEFSLSVGNRKQGNVQND